MCNQFKNSNEEINRIIGNYFLDDSRSFLSRYNLLIETATDKGRRCKLLVDMLFSIECSLKALLFFESKADEKVTYKKVKRIGHKLNNLFNEQDISKYSKINEYYNQIKSISLNDYEIHLRYTLESHIKFDPCYEKKNKSFKRRGILQNGRRTNGNGANIQYSQRTIRYCGRIASNKICHY